MSSTNIFLILISGLGVLHGLFLAFFLWVYPKGNATSNRILSLLLLVLSFRVGKSVLLEFAEDLSTQLVFIGLASLMAIGPLFYLYARSLTEASFRLKAIYLVHFIPTLTGLLFGVWMDADVARSVPKMAFVLMFAVYYGHYLLYLLVSYRAMSEKKSNTDSWSLLRLLFYGLLAIWFVYVLNLFDEFIPYIVGPILYTLVAYTISLIIMKKGYIKATGQEKYKTTVVSDDQIGVIFSRVIELVAEQQQFKSGDLSLKSLSEQLNVTPQVLSMVINRQTKTNFNTFVNRHRIEESIRLLQNEKYANYTVAAIAFEVGFNSISSFNTAFKNQTGSTPMAYRKQ